MRMPEMVEKIGSSGATSRLLNPKNNIKTYISNKKTCERIQNYRNKKKEEENVLTNKNST